jgi:UDP-glucose 4-epimerase
MKMRSMEDLRLLFAGKNVSITGGLGFIGSNLAIRLQEYGANVTLVDSLIPEYGGNLFNVEPIKGKVTVNIADVRDEHSIRHLVKRQDYLFNLVGQTSHLDSMREPFVDLEINCRAQLSILEACRENNPDVKIVFASTRQVYGRPQYLPVDEEHRLAPVDVNGINKISGEFYHLLYNDVYGIRSCVLRLTNSYGPRMRIKDARQTFLGIWIRRILEGQTIDIFGSGMQLRDFNYVEDVVDALLLAASKDEANGKVFNLGSDERISLNELAAKLIRIGEEGESRLVPFPDDRKAIDIGDYYSNWEAIREELGWSPRTCLDDGLRDTLAYYRVHLSQYI